MSAQIPTGGHPAHPPSPHAPHLAQKLQDRSARIAVLGLGYVGLPLAVHLARAGFSVTGFDPQEQKVSLINSGRSPVQDVPDDQVNALVLGEKLRATASPAALQGHDVFIICVPTPLDASKQPEMGYIHTAALHVADHLRPGTLVILESTTYPGTTDEFLLPLLEKSGLKGEHDLYVAFSPERVDPGNRTFNTGNIPKIVGGTGPHGTALAQQLYETFLERVFPVSSARVAEMAKLHENTFRAVNIGYVNELAMICTSLGINVWEVIDAASTKPFGFMPFYPGPGIGGHCIPLDPHYLAWRARKQGFSTRFIELADQVNSQMPRYVVGRLMQLLNDRHKSIRGTRVLALGVAYKPDVDDARESPALDVIAELERFGAQVQYADPYVPQLPQAHGHDLHATRTELSAESYAWADVAIILTPHAAFDWESVQRHIPLILDTRGVLRASGNVVTL
ncbi:nucleotide sugar dehydrogenase [Deinococcus ficus]|uniref:UDP-glucose/GDP-mannose dehydrogenase C-terminal domain-containing protein n=1 Tax=Deinococcus ficus TaxID=317577 RepID=A0A221T207_9DEIO|nr:nucleotide sugar dehydrogenase [Deinococcus ficus]ASN82932.1 hypothetical protein DFI_17245 [Deinococcus ficus]